LAFVAVIDQADDSLVVETLKYVDFVVNRLHIFLVLCEKLRPQNLDCHLARLYRVIDRLSQVDFTGVALSKRSRNEVLVVEDGIIVVKAVTHDYVC